METRNRHDLVGDIVARGLGPADVNVIEVVDGIIPVISYNDGGGIKKPLLLQNDRYSAVGKSEGATYDGESVDKIRDAIFSSEERSLLSKIQKYGAAAQGNTGPVSAHPLTGFDLTSKEYKGKITSRTNYNK